MGFDILDSVISFAGMMFALLFVVIVLTTFIKLKDILVTIIGAFIRPIGKAAKLRTDDSMIGKISKGLYYVLLLMFIMYLLMLLDSPLHGDELPESDSLWNVLMALLPVVILLKIALYFKDEIDNMGKIINKDKRINQN